VAKDINYFIIEAKSKIRKELTFIDICDILQEAQLSSLIQLEASVRGDDSNEIGTDFNNIIDQYIEGQGDLIDTLAADMLREYQEDRKVEADQDRLNARNGL